MAFLRYSQETAWTIKRANYRANILVFYFLIVGHITQNCSWEEHIEWTGMDNSSIQHGQKQIPGSQQQEEGEALRIDLQVWEFQELLCPHCCQTLMFPNSLKQWHIVKVQVRHETVFKGKQIRFNGINMATHLKMTGQEQRNTVKVSGTDEKQLEEHCASRYVNRHKDGQRFISFWKTE